MAIAFVAGLSVYFFLEDPELVGPPPKPPTPSPNQYTLTKLISTETSGPDTKLLKIAAPPHFLHLKDSRDASIWSLFIKDDDIQVERAYTPLNGVDSNGDMLFWIKKYPKGEVGRWLHAKNAGENIEVRGPIKTYPWQDGIWDEVIMVSTSARLIWTIFSRNIQISGGTGITPFIQLFNTVISESDSTTRTNFTLVHSSRSPSALPPASILKPMAAFASTKPDKFKLHVFVDELDEAESPIEEIKVGRIQEADLKRIFGNEEPTKSWWKKPSAKPSPHEQVRFRTLVLVCGPEPWVTSFPLPICMIFTDHIV